MRARKNVRLKLITESKSNFWLEDGKNERFFYLQANFVEWSWSRPCKILFWPLDCASAQHINLDKHFHPVFQFIGVLTLLIRVYIYCSSKQCIFPKASIKNLKRHWGKFYWSKKYFILFFNHAINRSIISARKILQVQGPTRAGSRLLANLFLQPTIIWLRRCIHILCVRVRWEYFPGCWGGADRFSPSPRIWNGTLRSRRVGSPRGKCWQSITFQHVLGP